MKCARCGTALDDDAMVCGQCGAVVGASYGPADSKRPFAQKPASFLTTRTAATPRLLSRVKSLMGSPRSEWQVIANEPTTAAEIYTGYAMPLAAIGAIALFVSHVTIGTPVPLIGVVKAALVTWLAAGLLMFALALVHLFLMAMIVGAMAPRFGGQPDTLAALKLAAYSYTPIWLAGVLYLFPRLAVLWLAACLYALYLAVAGLPALMRCPRERAVPYALVAGACAIGLFVVIAGMLTAIIGVGPDFFD